MYYLYTKSSKEHGELKNLYDILKSEFEIYTSTVRLVKATSTRWINHKLRAMDCLIEKFELCHVHLNDIISTTTNSKEKATLEGKFNNLVDAKVLLHCALVTHVLAEEKKSF